MADNIIGNTTGLPENSGIGTNYNDGYTVEKMTNAISKHNLELGRKTDARVAKFYDIVYQMVADMTREEKINILTEYGSYEGITQNSTKHQLNAKVTEVLITHLENDALENMLRQIKAANAAVSNIVNTSQSTRQTRAKNILRKIKFEEMNDVNTKNPKKINNDLKKKYGNKFAGSKDITSKYPKLKKELQDVLKNCFNNVEIGAIADSMNIETEVDDSVRNVSDKIISKTILYVHIITGHSKNSPFMFSISNPEPYNNLLKMTSYSYITGEPGLDPGEWAILKNQARRAKVLMKERAKQQRRRLSSREKEFTEVAGAYNSRNIEKALRDGQDNGVLANASYDKLIELAGKYGIDPTRKNIAKLKLEIYRAMAADLRDTRNLEKKSKRASKNRILGINRTLEDRLSVRGNVLGAASESDTKLGSDIPLLTIDKNGNIPNTESITKAVPVVIVGEKKASEINAANNALSKLTTVNGKMDKLRAEGLNTDNIQSSLPPEDVSLLMQFLSLKTNYDITDDPNISLTSFAGVEFYLKLTIKSDIIEHVKRRLTTAPVPKNPNDPVQGEGAKLAMAYLWYYAKINGRTKIVSYIDKYFKGLLTKKEREISFRDSYHKRAVSNQLKRADELMKKDRPVSDMNQAYLINSDNDVHFFDLNTRSGGTQLDLRNYSLLSDLTIFPYDYLNNESNIISLEKIAPVWATNLPRVLKKDVASLNDKSFIIPTYATNLTKVLVSPHVLASKFGARAGDPVDSLPAWAVNIPVVLKSNAEIGKDLDLVIPVWVLNMPAKPSKPDGSKTPKKSRADLLADYEAKYPGTTTGKRDWIKLNTKGNTSVSTAADTDTLRSGNEDRRYSPNKANAEYYHPTVKTLEWTLKNGKQFAQGGAGVARAFIAGDSLNGQENPELVRIHKNGSFSVSPIRANAANGNSRNSLNAYGQGTDNRKTDNIKLKKYMSDNAKDIISSDEIVLNKGIQAAYLVNGELSSATSVLSGMSSDLKAMSTWIQERLPVYFMSFGNDIVTAPMGMGTVTRPLLYTNGLIDTVKNAANGLLATAATGLGAFLGGQAINMIKKSASTKMASGGTIKSSGTAAITGDATGSNIFANGAKPELVQSTGDMKITPLNKTSEVKNQKIQRMTAAERNSALAVGISSHIVKTKYSLDSNTTDVSNSGEAIKVYSIKPGIADKVDVGGSSYSLMELMVMINAQLTAITQNSTVGNTILEGILKSNSQVAANTTPTKSGSANPFLGDFPPSLDNILQGG